MKQKFLRHRKLLISLVGVAIAIPLLLIIASYLIIEPSSKYILSKSSQKHTHIGIVLGAGVDSHGKPYKELQARLDLAAEQLNKGQVDKLILSGDNRFHGYNEPDAMKDYLIQTKHVAANKLQPDYAGRSTYESCERAAKVFGLKDKGTIIYSAESHLPRAIFLCRHFGVTAYGVGTNIEANNHVRREALARVKAVFNAYILGERTILGKAINVGGLYKR